MAGRRRGKNKLFNSILLIILIILIGLLCYIIYVDKIKTNNTKEDTNITTKKNKEDNSKKEVEKTENKVEKNNTENSVGPMETEEEETKKERDKNISINLELIGEEEITIKKGDKYTDPGVKATDSDGNDMTDEIEIINNVDSNKAGKYSIVYSYGKNIIIRTVIVE